MAFGTIAPGMDDEDALLQLGINPVPFPERPVPTGGFGASAAVPDQTPPQNASAPSPPTPAGDQIDWSRMNQPLGELKPLPTRMPSQYVGDVVGDPIVGGLTGLGMSNYNARHLTGGLGGIINNLTPVGIGLSAADAVAAKSRGDNPALIGAMAGLIPGVRMEENMAREVAADAAKAPNWHGALEAVSGQNIQPTGVGVSAGERALPAGSTAATAPSDIAGGIGGGEDRLGPAQAQAERAAGAYAPLPGLPNKALPVGDQLYVPGPIAKIKDVAEQYMRGRPTSAYFPAPDRFYPIDKEHSKNVAQAYEDMQHAPNDPAVKNSYDAMIKETRDQYDAIRKYHPDLQLVPNKPGEDPYAATPRLAAQDIIQNNRLHFFPTEQGYGSEVAKANEPQINWNRERVGLGGPAVGKDRVVMDLPVRDLEAAHKATDPSMFIETPRKQVVDHMSAGNPISLPEVNVYNGQLRYTNGRNRVAAARELGASTVPVAVDRNSVDDLQNLLQKHGAPEADPSHPMLQPSGRTLDGKPLLNNDLFRIVHDYFGHFQEGYGFRAAGEDNAWRKHASMYSDLARPAMTSETRGQNSWVNFGPHAEQNKGASAADTIYAPQKVGIMPEWTMRDRGSPEPMITYRGSPSAHSMVDMSKIGSGEGSGVRGQGMYSAEAPPIASFYRHFTATTQDPLLKKYKLSSFDAENLGRDLGMMGGDHEPIVEDLNDHLSNLKAKVDQGDTSMMTKNQIATTQNMIKYLNDPKRATGHMYQLALDKPDEQYLHWDKPYWQQSQYVKDRLQPMLDYLTPKMEKDRLADLAKAKAQLARNPSGIMNQVAMGNIRRAEQPTDWSDVPGATLYERAADHALGREAKNKDEAYPISAQYLRSKGIAGVKYLAGQNFNLPRGVPAGSHNYVNFNPERILKRYAIPGALGTGLGASMMSRGQDDGS